MIKLPKFSQALIIVFILFAFSPKVLATVGGDTYVSQIAYNPLSNLIYYISTSYSGRGCPPILRGIDTLKSTDREVKTCEQVFEEFSVGTDMLGDKSYKKYISDFYKELTPLGSVSLKKNNISINVVTVSEQVVGGETMWTNFRATVTQNQKTLGQINFRGCSKDQPHLFEGYMVSDSDQMAILISNKGDCFEGGYVNESLHLIKGVTYYDTAVIRAYKQDAAAEPNAGNYVITASVGNPKSISGYTSREGILTNLKGRLSKINPLVLQILFAATIFGGGILVGNYLSKKQSKTATPLKK